MYGLPADSDFSFLVHRTLEMVCVTSNTMTVHFGNKVFIKSEGSFLIRGSLGDVYRNDVAAMIKLLDLEIVKVDHTVDSISIWLENAHKIQFLDENRMYESFVISDGTREIIV